VAETLTLRTEIAKPARGMQRVAGLREAASPPRSLRGCLLGQRVRWRGPLRPWPRAAARFPGGVPWLGEHRCAGWPLTHAWS
jgi:hypothetical protein